MKKFFKGLKEKSRSHRKRGSQTDSPVSSSPTPTPDRHSSDIATPDGSVDTNILPQNVISTHTERKAVGHYNLKGTVKTLGDYPFAHGGFSDIWRGTWVRKDRDIQVAVKVLKPYEKAEEDLFHELSVWAPLVHTSIARCFGFLLENADDGIYAALVTEWHPSGTVIEYLQQKPEADRLLLSLQIAEGVQHLHSLRPFLIHGDLKGANILISADGVPKLCDFGLAELMADTLRHGTSAAPRFGKGSTRWASQELFSNTRGHKSRASDVWALGALVLEILTGKIPFHRQADVTVVRAITRGKVPSPEDYEELSIDHPLWKLFSGCWQWWPERRPSVNQFVEFIRNIDNIGLVDQFSCFDEGRQNDWTILSNRDYPDSFNPQMIAETEVDSVIYSFAISPNCNYVAIPGFRTSIEVFDGDLKHICSLSNDNGSAIAELAFVPNSTIIAGGANNESSNPILLWDVTTQEIVGEYHGHSQPIVSLVFTSEGRHLITSAEDLTLRIWDINNDPAQICGLELDTIAYGVVVSGDGHYIAASTESGVRIWGLEPNGQLLTPLACFSWLVGPMLRAISVDGVSGLVIHGQGHARASFWPFAELVDQLRAGTDRPPLQRSYEIFDLETSFTPTGVVPRNYNAKHFSMLGLGKDIVVWDVNYGTPVFILRDQKEAVREYALVEAGDGCRIYMRRGEKLIQWKLK